STSTKPIVPICPMRRATSSTPSVLRTRSLCPRRAWACCASGTRMAPSFPTLQPCGNEQSNCTPWAHRIVEPTLSPPAMQLLDFLYGEWGVIKTNKGDNRVGTRTAAQTRPDDFTLYRMAFNSLLNLSKVAL